MNYPNFTEEKKFWKQGLDIVAGLDEVGRGPLAGPVVAAAVYVKKGAEIFLQKNFGINDSKKLTEKNRELYYEKLTNDENVKWGIGIISETIIDKINILEATKLAMKQALEKLQPEALLIDGNFLLENMVISQKSVIGGDQKVFSIAAASIIAKVTRDRMMHAMHELYPQYGFDKHKGYGTALHIKNLKQFGPCEIHRKSFYPVSLNENL